MSTTTQPEKTAVAQPKPGPLQILLSKIFRPRPTGVHCDYCGWTGTRDLVLKAPKVNEDGAVYQIDTCPGCMRNGGLIFYD